MPEPPHENESRSQFIGRCISYMATNHPNQDKDQAAAICHSYWENHIREKMKRSAR